MSVKHVILHPAQGPVSPLLRWAGSKRKLLPRLVAGAPKHYERYVEPFAGSACLFFYLGPSKALLSDINRELITTYQQIKGSVHDVYHALTRFKSITSEAYYAARALDPQSLTPTDRAARFIFLNRLCFNGLYRTNTAGVFNVPYGAKRAGNLPTFEEMSAVSSKLSHAELKCASFDVALTGIRPGDFVYLDPPYSIANRRVFNHYGANVFGTENLQILRSNLETIDSIGAQFLLSYGLSKEGLALGQGFKIKHALVQRQISGFAAHRRKARELLITNY